MALRAVLPKTAGVDIFFLMAAATQAAGLEHLACFTGLVAFLAKHFFVPAIQSELGGAVVKIPGLPAGGDVTVLTVRTKTSFVLVIFFMATQASHGRIAESRCDMAVLARHQGVAAGQRVARLVVVKQRALPLFFVVAALTFRTQLTQVFVIAFVAADARGVPLGFLEHAFFRRMAGITFDRLVAPFEPVFGFFVMVKLTQ